MKRRPTRVRSEFWDDLVEAIEFYNSRSPGLGDDFAEDVRLGVRRAADTPEAFKVVRPPFRRLLIRRFGQLLVYAVDPDRVYFIGIVHAARDFERWLKARG